MSSKTVIANKALYKTGDRRVANVETDTGERAQVINSIFDFARDQLLTAFPWNFAIKRATIAKSAVAPDWGYANQYPVPTDFLSLLSIKGDPQYVLESNQILTDSGSPLYIRYIRRVEDVGSFDPLFSEVLACELAVEIVERISGSNTKKKILAEQRERAISIAYANDSIQEPPQNIAEDAWITSRESSLVYDDIDYNA